MNAPAERRDRPRKHEITDTGLDVVTGAFSYSGSAIARELIATGRRVQTVIGHPERAPRVRRSTFTHSTSMVRSRSSPRLKARPRSTTRIGCASPTAPPTTTKRSRTRGSSFAAARDAGVQRIVHVSITHPSVDSPLPYFRGKALVEHDLIQGELPYAILRPAILFGGEGVLLNNIAWLMRHLPVFAIGGRGE